MKIYSISSAKEAQNKLSATVTGLEESYLRQDQIVRVRFNSDTKEEGYDIHNEPAIIRRYRNMKQLIRQIKSPCDKCPYKLGLVQTLMNPCPQCKENGYQTFERLQQQASRDYPTSGEEHE